MDEAMHPDSDPAFLRWKAEIQTIVEKFFPSANLAAFDWQYWRAQYYDIQISALSAVIIENERTGLATSPVH